MTHTTWHEVFAYGSNMNLEHLRAWARERGHGEPRIERARPALLPGHRLVWNYRSRWRRAGAANVTPRHGAVLPGVLLRVDEPTLAILDDKEGHPLRYSRGAVPDRVHLPDGEVVAAWVYRVQLAFVQPATVPPSREYLDLLLTGAQQHALPDWHIEALRLVETSVK